MAAIALVGCRDDLCAALTPHLDHPVDRGWSEVRAVAEDDDRRSDLRAQSAKTAPKGRAPTTLPLRAADGRRRGRDVVRAEDDERIWDRASAQALEHRLEEDALLGAAEARRGSGRENDDG